jgi:KipI family sensor histidine kinase inhibitor
MTFPPRIAPLGDSALLVQLGDEIDLRINQRVHALASLIHLSPLEGVTETVPAYTNLLIHYDPLILRYAILCEWIRGKLEQLSAAPERKPWLIEIPTTYGGEYGIDLAWVADYHHLRVEDVIRIHSQTTYTIYMMGFTPGFPYMGKLDDGIVTPRLETPRTRVPAGTVAVAGAQTGIYPIDSPGGWRLIGHTSLRLFDPAAESPFLFSPGDRARFVVER